MKTLKKMLPILLIALMLLAVFAACGGGGGGAKTTATGAVVSTSGSEQSSVQGAAVTPVISDSLMTTTGYVGNTKTKIFHNPGCGFKPGFGQETKFATKDEAIAAGYTACEYCKP